MSCKIHPTHAVATLMARFVDGKLSPGWDCATKKAVYSLASEVPSGCAVYMVASPAQRAELALPANNTHEACPASSIGTKTSFSASDIFLSEEGVAGERHMENFLRKLQWAHDSACRVGVKKLCNPKLRAEGENEFRNALEDNLRYICKLYGLSWDRVESYRKGILLMAEQAAARLVASSAGSSSPTTPLASLEFDTSAAEMLSELSQPLASSVSTQR